MACGCSKNKNKQIKPRTYTPKQPTTNPTTTQQAPNPRPNTQS